MLALERTGEPFLVMRDGDGGLHLIPLDADAGECDAGPPCRHGRVHPLGRGGARACTPSCGGSGRSGRSPTTGFPATGRSSTASGVVGRQRLRPGDRLLRGADDHRLLPEATDSSGDERFASGTLPEVAHLSETQRRILIALCRPYGEGGEFAVPASNQQIAGEVFLGIDAVKRHLRTLFQSFGLGELPQNQKRARLAELALRLGIVSQRDLSAD